MLGRIIASSYGVYSVLLDGNVLSCKPKGIFRHQEIKPLVGDYVHVDEEEMIIDEIKPRVNSLIRPSIANIDEVAIVMSTIEPNISSTLINKFLSYANYNEIKAFVIITKVDKTHDESNVSNICSCLKKMGVEVFVINSKDESTLSNLKEKFKNETIALMGQTGVGKSSLINALVPDSHRDIGEYSKALGRGKHKTKEVVLIPLQGGFIADTPGFSSLELPFEAEDLAKCFPGFKDLANKCKFADCIHVLAKECAIMEALEQGVIAQESYEDYQKILNELKMKRGRY